MRVQVGWGDCDPAGIVFYPRFYAWMDMGAHALAREMGISRESMVAPSPDLLGFPVVATQAEYSSPAFMDDHLEVRTRVARVGRSSFGLRHEIRRVGEEAVLVRGREERVLVGRDARGALESRELTPTMRETLARYAEPDGLQRP